MAVASGRKFVGLESAGIKMDLLMIVAVLCAYFVKGMCGFANTLVHTTILGSRDNNISITPVELLIGYPSNLVIAVKERKSIVPSKCISLALLVLLGCIPGTFLLKNGDVTAVKIFFGVVVTFVGIEMFFREYQKEKRKSSKILLGIIGLLSGFLCGMFGIGALMAAYMSRTTEDSQSFRGNLCVVFLVENTFRIVLYTVLGILNAEVFKQALMLLPFMLLGLFAGMWAAEKMPEKVVKRVVIVMLILSGISLIVKNVI